MENSSDRNGVPVLAIVKYLGPDIIQVYGFDEVHMIYNVSTLEHEDEQSLGWVKSSNINQQEICESSKAKVLIVGEGVKYSEEIRKQCKTLIVVNNPRLSVAKVIKEYFEKFSVPIVNRNSFIHPEAEVGKNVYIGPNSTIGKCIIGDNVQIHGNVIIYDKVEIQDNVIIHSGSVIGVDGLGCERLDDGSLFCFPHIGGVILEKDVLIGANCQIAKGTLSNTKIGKGSKINAGCYIAHNVSIGTDVWISPHVAIGGSSKICDNATLFIGCMIRDNRIVGKQSIIGIGSVVTKNVPSNEIWFGNPAHNVSKMKFEDDKE